MKVNRKKAHPTAIFSADWHLTEKQPLCRTDDFWEAQWGKIKQIKNLCEMYNAPLFIAGDIFDQWKVSPLLTNLTIKSLPENTYIIAGNHDLPQHNLDFIEKSSLFTLTFSHKVKLLNQGHYGKNLDEIKYYSFCGKKIVILHKFFWHKKLPWPGCEEPQAKILFKKFEKADIILTGDNHQTFTIEKNGRYIVNPGSLTRQKADQVKHKPCVFFWYGATGQIKPYFLDIKRNVIDRSHIEKDKEKDKKISKFMEKLDAGWSLSLNFEDNMSRTIKKNKLKKGVTQIINKWMGA